MRLKFVATIFFLLLILKANSTSSVSCDLSLTEMLCKKMTGTVFTCRILYTDSNPKTYLTVSTAIITEVFFGSVDSDTVTLSSQRHDDVHIFSAGSEPKDTVIRTYEKGDHGMLIYTGGSGHKFGYAGICAGHSKALNDSPEIISELTMLRQFSSIYKNKKSGSFTFSNSNNIILAEGKFKKGVAKGLWKHYYDDGIIKTVIDLKENITTTYSPEGIMKTYTKTYRDSNVEYTYAKGILNYELHTSYKDSLELLCVFEYYPNGKIKEVGSTLYIDHKALYTTVIGRTGRHLEYYESGKLKLSGQFDKEKKIGLWKWYDENGDINKEFDYKDGKGTQ